MASNSRQMFQCSSDVESGPVLVNRPITLLELPEEILYNIISYLSYNEISESRNVCQTINKLCQQVLNHGFTKVDKQHTHIQKRVKSQLPRRESERRNHPLARHVDILSAIETRLSLLGMTYTRYIDMGLCCFIPGKVLDELLRILATLQRTDQPPRAHEFLQELRDISSMAMEHFEEKISPALKARLPAVTLPFPFGDHCSASPEPQHSIAGPSTSPMMALATSPMRGNPLRQEVIRLQMQCKTHTSTITQCKKELVECKNRHIEQSKRISEQSRKIQTQAKVISEQVELIKEHDKKISDLSKKILEYDQKFSDVYTELSKMKGEGETSTAARDFQGSSFIIRSSESSKEDLDKNKACLKRRALRQDYPFKKQKT
ncbi:F-box only protein 28-like [Ylistrum balloti]|uniref:F-box only protein 28-like n=1 Tax=Ylistrum balloti TaxID=509963 RepID=UPI002905A047|nr:F-box only protein 28-like [Ylistrum balloti]